MSRVRKLKSADVPKRPSLPDTAFLSSSSPTVAPLSILHPFPPGVFCRTELMDETEVHLLPTNLEGLSTGIYRLMPFKPLEHMKLMCAVYTLRSVKTDSLGGRLPNDQEPEEHGYAIVSSSPVRNLHTAVLAVAPSRTSVEDGPIETHLVFKGVDIIVHHKPNVVTMVSQSNIPAKLLSVLTSL